MSPPALADRRLLAIPALAKRLQLALRFLDDGGGIDLFEIGGRRLADLRRDDPERVADHIDDAKLDPGVQLQRLDGIWKARQAVHRGNENVFEPPVLELGQHRQPLLGALGLVQPQTQQLLLAVQIAPQDQMDGLVDQLLVLAHFHHNEQLHKSIYSLRGLRPYPTKPAILDPLRYQGPGSHVVCCRMNIVTVQSMDVRTVIASRL